QLYILSGNFREGAQYFSSVKNLTPQVSNLYNYALCLYEIMEYERALPLFEDIRNLNHDDDYTYSVYLLQAACYCGMERFTTALSILEAAEKKYGLLPDLAFNRARVLQLSGRSREFLAYAESMRKDRSLFPEILPLLARYHLDAGDRFEALRSLLLLVQINSTDPAYLKAAGDVFLKINDHYNALNYYEKALALKTADDIKAEILNNSALIYLQMKNTAAAEKNLAQALRHTAHPGLDYNLALFYRQQNDNDKFAFYISRAVTAGSRAEPELLSRIYFQYGELYGQKNDPSGARAYYQKALEIDPRNMSARIKFSAP
ncbi:MAG TPA: hypothetical protein DC049_09520, partial [Spirochaetia bacterium]|nr:hypothetical protein [Spirochaetia bacterium]